MTHPSDPPGAPEPSGPETPDAEPAGPFEQRRWPPVCAAIIGGSVVLYVLDVLLSQGATLKGGLGPVFQWTALYGPLVQGGQYWRVLTCVLSHGSPLHLFFNMGVAYSLGVPLERSIGSGRFLLVSLVTAMGASVFSLLFDFKVPTVGASGMILGWAGAMFVTAGREFRRSLLFWFAQVAVISLLPGVSWSGHLGGLLFGLPMGIALRSGPRVFARAAPLLLAITVAVVYIAAHPERFRGTP
ncbi:rhomboid family intramembrane serine protease [Vitiosangium sp. GDMCC 1.1324]|uniref:rhomboid family intramembrane serine protease n=1 Tax=Vitiosangium sp. (strain GDMCC 1.1324) TaxID=2138576 RepID=UPI000D343BD3|nr:rhomboid family intramembrane serine protease [Vitiosangium sp. GDMCC 1.1324]PTL76158.1 rhomboid family intramembrane serine protease [Vitiosangium sp. GDMCC 1.1324]